MLSSNFLPLRAESPTATLPSRSTAGPAPGQNDFGRLFDAIQSEVSTYIEHGDHGLRPLAYEKGDGGVSAFGMPYRIGSAGSANGVAPADQGETPQQRAFLESIAPWARAAGEQLGVSPDLVAAHAALESGWGRRALRAADGRSSHNLFGIKAGPRWSGEVTEATTTEYVNGAATKTRGRFRVYPDAASAFRDYTRMLVENPRFRGVLGVGDNVPAFAHSLAQGAYATDPGYGDKLARLAARLVEAGIRARTRETSSSSLAPWRSI